MDHSDRPSTSKEAEKTLNDSINNEPSSSVNEEEMQKDARRLEQRLEECAKKYNLSSLNVKNIIFYMIKDPSLAALIHGDANAIEGLRLTRSRLRELEKEAQTKLNIELKPVNTKSTRPTLLDIELSDDDADSDYVPPPDEPEEVDRYEFEDFTEEEFNNTEDLFGHDVGDQMEIICRDPEYARFIEGCINPTSEFEYPEETDEDYNIVQDDEGISDLDEFRNDRSTRVSKRELRHLYDDIFPDEVLLDEPLFKKAKTKPRPAPGSPIPSSSNRLNNVTCDLNCTEALDDLTYFDSIGQTSSRQNMQERVRRFEQIGSNKQPEQTLDNSFSSSKSWSLLKTSTEPARFTDEELHCLRIQLEKHVQLLTQHIVTTTDSPSLLSTRNHAVRMLHELDSQMYTGEEYSIFHIRTLPEAVVSCHEVESFDDAAYEQLFGCDAKAKYSEHSFPYKAGVVLSRSKALIYPELLPTLQPQVHTTPLSTFITAEQMLLALALFELHHVPHSTGGVGRINVSKYQTISTHFLPNKTSNQIRNHLKNVRSGSHVSPLHQLIMFAEQGKFNATVELDTGLTQRPDAAPIDWPTSNSLPRWLQAIQNLHLSQQAIQLPPIVQSVESVEFTSPDNKQYSVVQIYDGQVQMVSPQVVQISNGVCPPVHVVFVNESGQQIIFDQTTTEDKKEQAGIPSSSRIPNSPFQTYTLKQPPPPEATTSEINVNEVIVIDEEEVQTTPNVQEDAEVNPKQQNQRTKELTKERGGDIEKMSRRQEQKVRCMRGFEDPEVVDACSEMVSQAVYNLIRQRLFMHQGKLSTFLSILNNSKKTCAAKYDELARLIHDTYPELADCVAALMDDEYLRPDQEQNPERKAYKCALEMLMSILIYFNGQQNAIMKKRLLNLIRELCFMEQDLRGEMQKLLSGRHEPLWTLLKQYFRGEFFKEKVDMSRGEEVPLSVFNTFSKYLQGKDPGKQINLHAEFVDLTTSSVNQKLEQEAFKSDIRLKNGYLILRLASGEIPVNLCSPSTTKGC